MISGLGLFEMKLLDNGKYSTTEFVDKLGAGNKTVPYSTQEKFVDSIGKIHYSDFLSGKYRMMYFGDGKDGAQKYGKQTVKLDGEDRTFYFKTFIQMLCPSLQKVLRKYQKEPMHI